MDALKIQEQTDVGYKSCNPASCTACGHDAHTASLIGAARILKAHEAELNCTVKLIFQPAEEICKGAKMVMDEGIWTMSRRSSASMCSTDIPVGFVNIVPAPAWRNQICSPSPSKGGRAMPESPSSVSTPR